ncbi:F-box protein, partial [Aureobasidium melanogenum]
MNSKPLPRAAAGPNGLPKQRAGLTSIDASRRPNTPSNVFASLKATQILTLKPVLPAELIATILDYLPVSDLITCARVSRRLQEMVYEDSRWVAKLRDMGVWNEIEARQRYEESKKKRLSGRPQPDRALTLFDAHDEEEKARKSLEQAATPRRPRHSSVTDGFDDMTLSQNPIFDAKAATTALRRVRSIRGQARQEYGKVHGALGPFYYNLVRSENSSDPAIFRLVHDPEQQARIFADLRVFSRSDGAQKWRQRQDKLESMLGIFENAMISEFEQAYQAQDVDRMRRYAHVLVSLNGGAAGVDIFISNHPYMRRKDQTGSPLECLQDVAPGHVDLNPSQRFFEKLASMLSMQSSLIDQIFPSSVNVLLPFTTRVCEDIVSDYITTLFIEAHENNVETYLKAVSGIFEQAMRFAVSIQPPKSSGTDFHDQIKSVISHIFEPHVDRYLTEELDYFTSKCSDEVGAWEKQLSDQEAETESFFMSGVNRQAAKRDFLSSFKKVVMMPVNALPTFPSANKAAPIVEAPTTEQTSQPETPDTPTTSRPAPTTELAAKTAIMNSRLEGIKSLFSIEVALSLIHHAKASIERAAIFIRMSDKYATLTKEQCDKIFISLLEILGRRHMQNGFDKAVGHLSSYNPRAVKEFRSGQTEKEGTTGGVEPLVTFLELVNVGDLIQQMVDVFYMQELVTPGLTDRDDFLNPAVKEKKRFEQMLDERVAAGMGKGIDVLMDEVEYMCATLQLTADFNTDAVDAKTLTGNDKRASMMGLVDIGPTETAKRVVDTIQQHTGMLVGSTDKNMLDVFNQEVGLRLFGVLCKHIKRQRIGVDGAIKLISDINLYSSFITSLRQKSLLPYYSALRELSQIYLELATIIADNDRYHGIFRAEEVYEFAERRADWYAVRRDVERAMYGIGCTVM